MTARTLMVQGTASSVGKSLLATGLCRLFARRGYRVAPFKAQNMALNSAVTVGGGEIGRAQAVQAEAAGVTATVDMNPVLLKPEGNARSQVVVLGRPVGSMTAADYHAHKPDLRRIVVESLDRLRAEHDIVLIEGAGSPAEINLRDRDIVNMHVAHAAQAPVLLVGDIDRGGVFAAFVGTLELLEPADRARIAGFVVNKFRGDVSLLQPGLDWLTGRTGVPVVGVVPHLARLRVADEDSVSLDHRLDRGRPGQDTLDVVVVRLPRISNYDDVEALEHEPGVSVRFVETPGELVGADLVVLPGTKSTIADLAWLRTSGIADAVAARAATGGPILGICGGYQMLGSVILDPDGVESDRAHAQGLGLLPVTTRFRGTKTTVLVRARPTGWPRWAGEAPEGEVGGYEIHMGVVEADPGAKPLFRVVRRGPDACDVAEGCVSADRAVAGTLLHGVLEDAGLRGALLAGLRERRGLTTPAGAPPASKGSEYDRLAGALEESLDLDRLGNLVGLPIRATTRPAR